MPKLQPLPIGISDYKKIIEKNYYYIDKTLLVKELLQTGIEVALITRPRRFGKTLNLSMLRYFFEKPLNGEDTSALFTNKAIWQDEEFRSQQGQYPVIFLTFKDVKEETWEKAYEKIRSLIASEYKRYRPLVENNAQAIDREDVKIFNDIAAEKASETHQDQSLQFLTKLLQKITNQRVILLLDEYDSPIHAAYINGYYNKMVNFMRSLLTAALKDNEFLERGILTGILRTAKEGIFSGLNNLTVCTLLHDTFSDKFGFLSHEVDTLLKDQEIEYQTETIKAWYNGYRAGDHALLYNPWSIIECAKNKGQLKIYWSNTSDNALIKKLLIYSKESLKKELEKLINDIPVIKIIEEGFVFPGIEHNDEAIWSLLFFSGYITYSESELIEAKHTCTLTLPNKEIRILFKDLLTSIFKQSLTTLTVQAMMEAMLAGDVKTFSSALQEFIASSMSFYDYPKKKNVDTGEDEEPENSYHLFILGLCVLLSDTYHVRSNRESGDGRYDIMLIPRLPGEDLAKTGEKAQVGIVIELKKAKTSDQLEKEAVHALKQIKEKNYVQELRAQQIAQVIAYGIAFSGKKLLVIKENL